MKTFRIIREKKIFKVVAAYLAVSFIAELVSPSVAFALTSGPAQEEFASFEPASTSDMVDLYSGDFTYNIPLLSVPGPNGGYPINLAYHSGVGMDQEASWVGLGWNINMGAINRQMRGLPDDFKGDNVRQKLHMKESVHVGINFGNLSSSSSQTLAEMQEVFGSPSVAEEAPSTASAQVYYNNFKGLGYRVFIESLPKEVKNNISINPGLGIYFDSQAGTGLDFSPSISLTGEYKNVTGSLNVGAGMSFNTRQGLQDYSFSTNLSANKGSRRLSKAASAAEDRKLKNGQAAAVINNSGIGIGGGSSLSFGVGQQVPNITIPTRTTSFPFDIKINPATTAVPQFGTFRYRFPNAWNGSVSVTRVPDDGVVNTKGYGYINTVHATNDDMRDFQREQIAYSKKVPNLAPSSFTYDTYLQTGQGTGSMFRPYYNSVGILSDPARTNEERGYRVNGEFGIGFSPTAPTPPPPAHFGIGLTLSNGSSYSGAWQDTEGGSTGDVDLDLGFSSNTSDAFYEPYHFQVIGEKPGVLIGEHDLYSSWQGSEALRVKLDYDSDPNWFNTHFVAENLLVNNDLQAVTTAPGTAHNYKSRRRRATNIETFDHSEAQVAGYSSHVSKFNNPSAKSHHISEMSMLQADGMRYVYGLPAYNTSQLDATFSAENISGTWVPEVDVPSQNGQDIDANGIHNEFLMQNELDPYVHSWLLTSVLSADYVDLTGDGPSDDDYGYWVKFSYTKTSDEYQWRVPYENANYIEGNKSDATDDKGSVTFGKKQLYYVSSVETKTHIAIFTTSVRQDAVQAKDLINGGILSPVSSITDDMKMRKLDKITLYSKEDYNTSPSAAIPVKTVHFKYTYELCPDVPNNTTTSVDENGGTPSITGLPNVNEKKGKLTLKKLYFTYEKSTKGSLSPYIFGYGTLTSSADNPGYSKNSMDRWGNYKANFATATYPYYDFPYTDQEDYLTPTNPSYEPNVDVWSLKQIDLPTNGTIRVEYAPDDYAYVENKPAMRMFDIFSLDPNEGFSSLTASHRATTSIVQHNTEQKLNGGYRIYFKLEKSFSALSAAAAKDSVNLKYIKGNTKLYFKVFADLKRWNNPSHKDYVEGYANISDYGAVISSGNLYDYGYIVLDEEDLSRVNYTGVQVSPITKAIIQHLRVNRSELVHGPVPQNTNPINQVMNLMGSFYQHYLDIIQAIAGFNAYVYGLGYCQEIDLNGRSIIRLCDPDGKKFGGGVRVKSLKLDDNWSNTSSNDEFEYGQLYDYTISENGGTISSGVAYEPRIGKEESALRQPVDYSESTPIGSKNNLFIETPVMESYYPGESVGYRKVTVRSIASDKARTDNGTNDLEDSAAPISVYEFYTPKEFPVQFDQTDLSAEMPVTRFAMIPGIYSSYKKREARSQGYCVELNDMAGKLRSVTTLTAPFSNDPGRLIARQEFIYQTDRPFDASGVNKLASKVQVLTVNSSSYAPEYQTAVIGQTEDVFIDMNENRQRSKSRGGDLNLELQNPAYFIMPLIHVQKTETSLRTVVMNKIIYRTGILSKAISTTGESSITTENLAYDLETGEPLLTKVTNEFKDPLYNLNYPGHWYYAGMKGAYLNFGKLFTNSTGAIASNSTGRVTFTSVLPSKASDFYTPGDEVLVDFTGSTADGVYTVVYASPTTSHYIDCIDKNGQYIPSGTIKSIKVIRSGYRNLQTVKVGSLAARTSSLTPYDPLLGPSTSNATQCSSAVACSLTNILNASAVELSDHWAVLCGSQGEPSCICDMTQDGADLLNMISSLASYELLQPATSTYQVLLYNNGIYYYGFTPVLHSIFTNQTAQVKWTASVSGNTLTGTLDNGSQQFQVTLDGSSSFTWDEVDQVTGGEVNLVGALCSGAKTGYDITAHTYSVPGGYDAYSASVASSPYTVYNCSEVYTPTCGITTGTTINPYRTGVKGIWRPKRSYAYMTTRSSSNNTRVDGIYEGSFAMFPWNDPSLKSASWTEAGIITKYSPYGFELENRDALGVYSAAVYGYQNSLVTAIGSNTMYRELGYDNFEDYPVDCTNDHFSFAAPNGSITTTEAHTGIKSLNVNTNGPVQLNRTIAGTCPDDPTYSTPGGSGFPNYLAGDCDCIGKFSPIASKKYVLSAWVKEIPAVSVQGVNALLTYTAPRIKVEILNSSNVAITNYTFNFTASGTIIDGWQRVYGTFDLPASGAASIRVSLENTLSGSGHNTYFDDVRVHPFYGNMKSFVYHPVSLKVMAELDANNYATLYIYDEEGQLAKVKKETVEGIKTIKEGRTNK
jgi:hypothetical protein